MCRFGVRETVTVAVVAVVTIIATTAMVTQSNIPAAQIDFSGIWQGISDWFDKYITTPVGNLISSIWEWLRQLISVPFSILVDAGKALYDGVVGVFEMISDAVTSILRSFFGG